MTTPNPQPDLPPAPGARLRVIVGDCRQSLTLLPSGSVQCCVTSPPYWGLRDYGHEGQLGLESTPEEYVANMVGVFREVRRVLRGDGTLWLNLGDSYNAYNGNAGPGSGFSAGAACDTQRPKLASGHGLRTNSLKPKDLVGIPWRVAFALQADGWYLRQDIIWAKPNPMPESVTDRCTKAHEYVFLLSKSERYHYDAEAIKEQAIGENLHDLTCPGYAAPGQAPNAGNRKALRSRIESRHRSRINGGQSMQAEPNGRRNRRSVWTVSTLPFSGAHFAVFPPNLIKPMVLAGCPLGGTVLDPFAGSGTTGLVAIELGRRAVLCELNADYAKIIEQRTNVTHGLPLCCNTTT